MGKNPTAKAEDTDLSPGWGDPLGKEMATHSSILAWRIPWTEEPSRLQFTGLQRVTTARLSTHACTDMQVCEIKQYPSSCDWFISLGIMFSRRMHVVANVRISFFFKVE